MADKEEKPHHLRLAAENDQGAVDRELARQDLEWPLCNLAANLMRISRGAGSPHEILAQCISVVKAYRAFREVCRTWPSHEETLKILSVRRERPAGAHYDAIDRGAERVLSGALRMAAGRLLDQGLQAGHGHNEMFEGIIQIERAREENRKRVQAESRSSNDSAVRSQPKQRRAKRLDIKR
ncbi:hypothetical protein [Mesorhizobium sp. 1B3]|uniref:hypothetical protein n=1 Tax=Mesorhizobium sp. 1B3 TaxID=3243599 RepID=UPI003D9638F6